MVFGTNSGSTDEPLMGGSFFCEERGGDRSIGEANLRKGAALQWLAHLAPVRGASPFNGSGPAARPCPAVGVFKPVLRKVGFLLRMVEEIKIFAESILAGNLFFLRLARSLNGRRASRKKLIIWTGAFCVWRRVLSQSVLRLITLLRGCLCRTEVWGAGVRAGLRKAFGR